jgi:hypothetical protein
MSLVAVESSHFHTSLAYSRMVQCVAFSKKLVFYDEDFVSISFNPQIEGRILSAIRDIFSDTHHIWRPSPSATRGRAMPWWQGPT